MLGEPVAPRLTFAQLRHELVVLFKLRIVYLLLMVLGVMMLAR